VQPKKPVHFLSLLLRFLITALIAGAAAVAIMWTYSGFMHLVRAHLAQAGFMIGGALLCGVGAYVLALRRDDLADC
jgi:hypothetical protein